MSMKQNLFVSVFVHKCLMMLNDVEYKTFKMFVTQMSNYLFVISSQLRAFIGVKTAALTFRTKQYNTSDSSHICYGKVFYNDFFLNHNTIVLVRNCLKLLSCVVIETALDGMKKNQLS